MGRLPVGWLNTRLGEVVEYAKTIKTEPSVIKGNEWVLELEDIEKKSSKLLKRLSYSDRKSKSTKNRFLTGDVLYGKLRPYLDKIIIADQDGYCSTEIIPITPNAFLNGRYLFYSLKRKEFLNYVDKISHGLNMPRLGTKQGQLAPFILSPLNEQIRIANKLDSLLAKVEAAQTRLDKIPTLLKRFRQSVLAAATSGELTKEWRSGPRDSWNEIKVGDIVKKIEAGKNIKCDERPPQEDEFGIIKISAVTWGFYNESKSKTLFDTTKFIENRRIQVGDFLISRANTLELLGMPVIVQKVSKNLMLSDKVLRLVVNEAIDKKWLNIFLRSQRGRKEIESRATGNQQSMRNIGQKALLDIDLPYPEREEQKQIVKQVESLFTLADQVEKQYQQARLRTDKLSQSLLAKAFKGELVPQDPNDEPAEKLLARILEERETLKPAKKSRKAK
ncbi:MAG: restriction endonuclease subunit S [Methylococcaceae bacterium]|nr:restriction endonuclease subunit S [Methylococcaceae bacterium]